SDPADAQVAGEDRKDQRAPAATAIAAGDTGAAVRLLIDGVTGQPGAFDRLTPAIRTSLLDSARILPLLLGAPPPPISGAQLAQITVPVAIARGNWPGPSIGLRRTPPTAVFPGREVLLSFLKIQ